MLSHWTHLDLGPSSSESALSLAPGRGRSPLQGSGFQTKGKRERVGRKPGRREKKGERARCLRQSPSATDSLRHRLPSEAWELEPKAEVPSFLSWASYCCNARWEATAHNHTIISAVHSQSSSLRWQTSGEAIIPILTPDVCKRLDRACRTDKCLYT